MTNSDLVKIIALLNYKRNVICFYGTTNYKFLKDNSKLYPTDPIKESSSYCLSNINFLMAAENEVGVVNGNNGNDISPAIRHVHMVLTIVIKNYIITINKEA